MISRILFRELRERKIQLSEFFASLIFLTLICHEFYLSSILCSFGSSIAIFFFLANIPYFNFLINFQSSHLTKKETEDASKRLSSYCMEVLNSKYFS